MAQILDGKLVASYIKEKLKKEINGSPSLTIYQVGDNQASNVYIRNKGKACTEIGIENITKKYSTIKELTAQLDLDVSKKSCGMVQLPLDTEEIYDEQKILDKIKPENDPDCLTTINLGKLFTGDYMIAPCTAQGIIDLLHYYKLPIAGKNVVVVGRSNIVGKPIAHLMLQEDATVTICHSKTKNLKEFTSRADILIVSIGKPKFIKSDMVKENSVIIDVGINRDENNKLCGDVDYDDVFNKVDWITPVPGGVGAMTVAELMKNTVILSNIKKP